MITYIASALQSIWNNKVRSILTVLGVVIGVASVTILVALGQGLKTEVASMIQDFGTDIIIVIGGNIGESEGGGFPGNPADFVTGDILELQDYEDIRNLEDIAAVSPVSLVAGNIRYEEERVRPVIMGTYPSILDAFEVFSLTDGRIFNEGEQNVVVISNDAKETLFPGTSPLDKTVVINDKDFNVIGILSDPTVSDIFNSEYQNVVFIPFDDATEFNEGETINRIIAKAQETSDVEAVKDQIVERLKENNDGEEDFSVLTQDDLLGLFNDFLTLSTTLVSAIAAISLIVGGIGIMNIMLVTVTERTREIGLRKAVGATKRAILMQFLIEAIMITFLGGLIGLGIAYVVGIIVSQQTPLTPEITPTVVLMAIGISTLIGIIFGLWPAMRAANKDPIEALRHE